MTHFFWQVGHTLLIADCYQLSRHGPARSPCAILRHMQKHKLEIRNK